MLHQRSILTASSSGCQVRKNVFAWTTEPNYRGRSCQYFWEFWDNDRGDLNQRKGAGPVKYHWSSNKQYTHTEKDKTFVLQTGINF